ncbi:hypothetical protein [Microbacterium ulmi]|uniref:Cupin domain-containing protein n=1 Tax=Microbacterium ulmi TaxID=179095 RepID=A0A7Y2Q169_9MICO|nr:hypothetical protein [Microbacterium ulmi]NII69356.1 mannose-6-phosphate isomerase-like protein (cupin superfamily) [Microbacterium ulmi]NNH04032.1 hypothetical protein [Microbacterium ulmi]
MAGHVGRIDAGESLDPTPYFDGQWRRLERRTIQAGSSVEFSADVEEYALFVITGAGEVETGDTRRALTPGTAVTIGLDSRVLVRVGEEPLDLFITTLCLRSGSGGGC